MGVDLEGKVVTVTGGASGIGRATAVAFARRGAKVALADVTVEGGNETLNMIREAGGDGIFVRTDVSIASEVEAFIEETVKQYGRLDCSFNNAGIVYGHALTAECTEENWDRTIDVNLKGVWLCMKYEIPYMLKRGSGAIVNTASVAGLVGFQGLSPAYCASKGGILQLTRLAALEYGKQGIRVNAICPGSIRTPAIEEFYRMSPEAGELAVAMHPINRIGTPEEVAEAVIWLCSDAASFVTGHPMAVDGGYVAQ